MLLGFAGRWRVLATWLGVSVLVLGAVGVMKSFSYACGWRGSPPAYPWLGVQSPSGHTAAAAMTCGMLAALVVAGRRRDYARWGVAAALLAFAVVGVALVALRIHTVAEVLIGGTVGTLGTVLFIRVAGEALVRRFALRPLIGLAVIAVAIHGARLPAEKVIRTKVAALVRDGIGGCAMTGLDLRPTDEMWHSRGFARPSSTS